MTKMDSFVDRFLAVACGNVEEVSNRLDINRFDDDDTFRSDMDDDSFLTYFDDNVTIRTYFDDATLYTDDTTSTRYTDRGVESQRSNEQVKRAIDTVKKYADRLGVSGEEILRSPVLLKRIREQQRKVSRDAERKWRDILCTVACDESTFQCPSVMREWQDDLGCIGDFCFVSRNDDCNYASASVSEMDTGYIKAKQSTARAGNSNRRLTEQYSTRNVLQPINENHSDGKADRDMASYYDDDTQTYNKRRLVRLW